MDLRRRVPGREGSAFGKRSLTGLGGGPMLQKEESLSNAILD